MENKEELYDEQELEFLNKLGTISKEFQDLYNEEQETNNEQEK